MYEDGSYRECTLFRDDWFHHDFSVFMNWIILYFLRRNWFNLYHPRIEILNLSVLLGSQPYFNSKVIVHCPRTENFKSLLLQVWRPCFNSWTMILVLKECHTQPGGLCGVVTQWCITWPMKFNLPEYSFCFRRSKNTDPYSGTVQVFKDYCGFGEMTIIFVFVITIISKNVLCIKIHFGW